MNESTAGSVASTTPQSRIEELDRQAITDPRRSANFATNRAVRFHVEREVSALETRLKEEILRGAQAYAKTLNATRRDFADAIRDFDVDYNTRLRLIESRWWDRLWRDLVADISAIRRFLSGRPKQTSDADPATRDTK